MVGTRVPPRISSARWRRDVALGGASVVALVGLYFWLALGLAMVDEFAHQARVMGAVSPLGQAFGRGSALSRLLALGGVGVTALAVALAPLGRTRLETPTALVQTFTTGLATLSLALLTLLLAMDAVHGEALPAFGADGERVYDTMLGTLVIAVSVTCGALAFHLLKPGAARAAVAFLAPLLTTALVFFSPTRHALSAPEWAGYVPVVFPFTGRLAAAVAIVLAGGATLVLALRRLAPAAPPLAGAVLAAPWSLAAVAAGAVGLLLPFHVLVDYPPNVAAREAAVLVVATVLCAAALTVAARAWWRVRVSRRGEWF